MNALFCSLKQVDIKSSTFFTFCQEYSLNSFIGIQLESKWPTQQLWWTKQLTSKGSSSYVAKRLVLLYVHKILVHKSYKMIGY